MVRSRVVQDVDDVGGLFRLALKGQAAEAEIACLPPIISGGGVLGVAGGGSADAIP